MKGKRIYVVDEERVRKHKRDTYLLIGFLFILSLGGTMFSILYWNPLVEDPGINAPGVLALFIFSDVGVGTILFWAGIRLQPFAIYERGIVPPFKPWRKMFDKEYFIPYERIAKIDTDNWKIIEKNGTKSNLRSWFLFNFVRSGREANEVERMIKEIAKKVNEEKVEEIKEEELTNK
jgi:hypothetical protein